MTNWTRGEVTRTTIEYHVPVNEPWGADWNQVYNALNSAVDEWSKTHQGRTPWDNSIRVHTLEDEIVISFEKDT